MKNKFIFSCLKKGKIFFILTCFLLVFSFTLILDSKQTIEASTHETLNYTIVVDAGHGGVDPGSIGYKTKVRESDINLSVANILAEKLRKFGLTVVLTRPDSKGLYGMSIVNYKKRDMLKRREIIEAVNPNMVISIHMNSYTRHHLRGAQVFYDKSSEISQLLALSIQDQFALKIPSSDKGIAIGDYYMLKCTNAASVIAECGFLSNEEDEKLLITKEHQEKIADCIFVGIVNFLNHE